MTTLKEISKIEGFEDFSGYYVDIYGNIYSTRQRNRGMRKMNIYWARTRPDYKKVLLCPRNGKPRSLFVHNLVGKAFIPKHLQKRYVVHKTDNREDNSIYNLITIDKRVFKADHKAGRPRKYQDGEERPRYSTKKKQVLQEAERELLVSDDIINQIKLLYIASQIKGLSVGSEFDFINGILRQLIEDYSNQKGLKKIIYQMEKEIHH
jgi:hypothetical protein